ncbi:hypothetical protein NC652_029358 [Populus alba x Populus x berolinensis]|nr:hypothetical protein NC652_029358 [Populus alba x Populus x berolinensis]
MAGMLTEGRPQDFPARVKAILEGAKSERNGFRDFLNKGKSTLYSKVKTWSLVLLCHAFTVAPLFPEGKHLTIKMASSITGEAPADTNHEWHL